MDDIDELELDDDISVGGRRPSADQLSFCKPQQHLFSSAYSPREDDSRKRTGTLSSAKLDGLHRSPLQPLPTTFHRAEIAQRTCFNAPFSRPASQRVNSTLRQTFGSSSTNTAIGQVPSAKAEKRPADALRNHSVKRLAIRQGPSHPSGPLQPPVTAQAGSQRDVPALPAPTFNSRAEGFNGCRQPSTSFHRPPSSAMQGAVNISLAVPLNQQLSIPGPAGSLLSQGLLLGSPAEVPLGSRSASEAARSLSMQHQEAFHSSAAWHAAVRFADAPSLTGTSFLRNI